MLLNNETKFQMNSKLLITLWICLFSSSISYAQLSHEFHLGFSGLRIFEINPPEYFPQNLDYYLSPTIGYDLHVADNRVAIGLRLGSIYENGNNTFETDDFVQTRKEKRHSQFIEMRLAYNFVMQKKSYFQIGGGLRYGQVIYYSINRETNRGNNSVGIFNFEAKDLNDPFLDYIFFSCLSIGFESKKDFS